MRNYLIFQLYGPLASWGDIAVGETRPSSFAPAKSAVLGLIAAALGLRRPDTTQDEALRQQWDAQHAALAEGYGMAIKLTHPGLPLTDFHTAQVPSSGSGRNKKIFATRRDELTWISLNTILSRRDYRQDAFAGIALWTRGDAPYPLPEIKHRLLEPEFVLYLGRKSCPLALPLNPIITSAESVEAALTDLSLAVAVKHIFDDVRTTDWVIKQMAETNPMLLWDTDAETGISTQEQSRFTRRDIPTSRRRWQFTVRDERRAHLPSGDPA